MHCASHGCFVSIFSCDLVSQWCSCVTAQCLRQTCSHDIMQSLVAYRASRTSPVSVTLMAHFIVKFPEHCVFVLFRLHSHSSLICPILSENKWPMWPFFFFTLNHRFNNRIALTVLFDLPWCQQNDGCICSYALITQYAIFKLKKWKQGWGERISGSVAISEENTIHTSMGEYVLLLPGWTSYQRRENDKGISFHCFPSEPRLLL